MVASLSPVIEQRGQDICAHHLNSRHLFAGFVLVLLAEWLKNTAFLDGVIAGFVMHSETRRGVRGRTWYVRYPKIIHALPNVDDIAQPHQSKYLILHSHD